VSIIDQEQLGFRIISTSSLRDVLPVAEKLDEAERLVVEHTQEPGGPSRCSMSFGIHGGKKSAPLRSMKATRLGVIGVCLAPRSST
jgi:hypothetical protein